MNGRIGAYVAAATVLEPRPPCLFVHSSDRFGGRGDPTVGTTSFSGRRMGYDEEPSRFTPQGVAAYGRSSHPLSTTHPRAVIDGVGPSQRVPEGAAACGQSGRTMEDDDGSSRLTPQCVAACDSSCHSAPKAGRPCAVAHDESSRLSPQCATSCDLSGQPVRGVAVSSHGMGGFSAEADYPPPGDCSMEVCEGGQGEPAPPTTTPSAPLRWRRPSRSMPQHQSHQQPQADSPSRATFPDEDSDDDATLRWSVADLRSRRLAAPPSAAHHAPPEADPPLLPAGRPSVIPAAVAEFASRLSSLRYPSQEPIPHESIP